MSEKMEWKKLNRGQTIEGDFRKIQEPYRGVTVLMADNSGSPKKVAIKNGNEFGIHKKGCRDIGRSLNVWDWAGSAFPKIQMVTHYDTLEDALPDCIPCYARESSEYDDSIKECEEKTLKPGKENQFVYVYPCCKDAK